MQSTSSMLLEVISDNGGGSVRIFVREVDSHIQIAWGVGFDGGGIGCITWKAWQSEAS